MGWGPDAPDMSGANEAARAGAAMSKEQWEWTKARQPKLDAQADAMIKMGQDQYNLNREGQVFQQGLMKRQDDRYWNSIAPMEDEMFADARNFDTESRREELAGLAGADVNQGFSAASEQQARGLARMGVNPNSGKFLAMGNQMAMAQATALANAQNKVRAAARLEGYSRKVDATAMGKGLSGFNSGTMQGFASGALGATGVGMNGLGSASQQFNNGASSAANGMQNASQSLRENAIQSAKSPGFDAVMGMVSGGAQAAGQYYGSQKGAPAAAAASDRRLKTDIRLVGCLPNGLGVYTFRYKTGGAVVMGVMADELEKVTPSAVFKKAIDGEYDAVDYAQIEELT